MSYIGYIIYEPTSQELTMNVKEAMLRKRIKGIIKKSLNEASARSNDSARKWKQGDDLKFLDRETMEDDIAAELDSLDAAEYEYEDDIDDSELTSNNQDYTLDDIVNTRVLRTRSPAGTKAWIETTMDMVKRYIVDEDFAEAVMDLRDSENIFQQFQDTRDMSIKFWTKVASEQMGTDVSKLPEFSDNQYMNEFLFDFWMLATFVKPMIRQLDKGKSLEAANKSVAERWKYMTAPNRVKDFIKNVITPSFEYLLRDTSIMG